MEDNEHESGFNDGCGLMNDNIDNLRPNQYSLGAHGEHNPCRGRSIDCRGTLSPLSSKNKSPLSSYSLVRLPNTLWHT